MDSSPSAHSPDVTESRAAFRKSATDVSRRNYRRHSPSSSRSPSLHSPDGRKHNRSPSYHSQDDWGLKRGRRAESGSEAGRGDTERSRRGADAGTYDYYRNQNHDRYGRSDEYRYNHNRRYTAHHDRTHHSHSINSSGRDPYTSTRSDYYRHDGRRHSRADPRSPERTFRERGLDESRERRHENRLIERDRDRVRDRSDDRDRYRSKDREAGSARAKSGSKRLDIDVDVETERSRDSDARDREKGRGKDYDYYYEGKDRRREKDEARGGDRYKEIQESKVDRERMKENWKEPCLPKGREERKERDNVKDEDDYRSRDELMGKGETEDYKPMSHTSDVGNDACTSSGGKEDFIEHFKERSGASRDSSEEREKGGEPTIDGEKLDHLISVTAFKLEDAATANLRGLAASAFDPLEESGNMIFPTGDENSVKETKWATEAEHSSESSPNALSEAGTSMNDFNHAKMAAMRAAELVNKNLGAGGFMSADQKKRLLWASKNQESAAASGTNRWDTVQFGDRERQDKFNKLMGVKGDASVESEKDGPKVSGMFTTEKQQELQEDLEKQFSVGLRRRDGRTVGLGL